MGNFQIKKKKKKKKRESGHRLLKYANMLSGFLTPSFSLCMRIFFSATIDLSALDLAL